MWIGQDLFERWSFRKFRLLARPRRTAFSKDGGGKRRNLSAALRQFNRPVLRRPVSLDQADAEIERTLRDRRAEIDGQRKRIAGTLRMIDQRPQDGGGRRSAEWADESPVIVAGASGPAAVAGGHPRGVVEQVRGPGEHEIPPMLLIHFCGTRSRRSIMATAGKFNDVGGNGFFDAE